MEIKVREIIASVVIIAFMIITGVAINEKIVQYKLEQYQIYDTAVKIEEQESFQYGMDTNIGYAFVYGELKTLDPVSYPEVEGEYSYIKKEEQEYQKHYRYVEEEYVDSRGNRCTRTKKEEYWTWDTINTEEKIATRISFLNIEFPYDKIPFPSSHELKTVDTEYHKRNIYYGTETSFQGTIFTLLKDGTINETEFYIDQTISNTIQILEMDIESIIFWIFWIILAIGLVIGFYALENKWLD